MKRFWILLGALVVTLAALTLAMLLGSVSFDVGRYSRHEARLRKVMTQEQPSAGRLTQGLMEEGTPLVAATATRAEAERVIARHGGKKAGELRDKAARYPHMRLFAAADMHYFIFFDSDGVMRDFTIISR